MIYKETKRLIINIPTVIMIAMALAMSLLLTYITIHNSPGDDDKLERYYKEYAIKLEGEMTDEKQNFVNKEKAFISATLENEEAMLKKYNTKEISYEQYQKYLDDNFYASEHNIAIEKVDEQCRMINRIKKQRGESVKFIYDTQWKQYFNMDISTFIQMILIMILIIGYLSKDYSSGMWKMTQTYYCGRTKLFNIQLGLSVGLCMAISLLFTFVYYYIFRKVFFMPGMNYAVQSLDIFEKFPLTYTVAEMIIFISVVRIIALCMFGVFVFSITSLTKNITASFGICGITILLPVLFSSTLHGIQKLSFYEVVLGVGIMKRCKSIYGMLNQIFLFLGITLVIYAIAFYQQSDIRRKRNKIKFDVDK